MRDGRWLDAQQFAPLAWSVPGIVPEGFGLLVAPPKAGKSWLVAGIGLACAAGGMALSRIPVRQRPVLYMALEDGHRRLQSRFRTLMGDGQPIPPIELIIEATPKQVPDMIAEFLTRPHGSAAPLVILDTLGKVRPPKARGEDAYGTDYQLGGKLKRLVDSVPGSSLLVVHHTRKAESADFVDAVSGTQGIAGSADFVLVLNRARTSDQAVLSVTGRDVLEAEYAMVFSAGCWSLDGKDLRDSAATATNRRQTDRLSDRSTDALAFVQGRDETRAADLADHLRTTPDIAGRYLRRLRKRGVIDRTKSGIYVPAAAAADNHDGHPDTPARSPSTPSHDPEQVKVFEFGHSDTSDTSQLNKADLPDGPSCPGVRDDAEPQLKRFGR
ncbi:AAA family ATPase [Nocardia gipuzkoensis]